MEPSGDIWRVCEDPAEELTPVRFILTIHSKQARIKRDIVKQALDVISGLGQSRLIYLVGKFG